MRFLAQLKMEWRILLRSPFVWFCFIGFFALAFNDTVRVGWEAQGNHWINGAATITNRAIFYTLYGVVAVAGIMADLFSRDRRTRVQESILTTPAGRIDLGLARFLAAFLVILAATAMFIPGMILGTKMPGIAQELIGPTVPSHYAKAMLWFLIPNFLLISAWIYFVGAATESRTLAFAAGIGAIALWITTRMMLGRDVFRQEVFATYGLLDPFGTIASSEFTLSHTVAQHNSTFAPLAGLLATNRMVWFAISILLVGLGTWIVPMRPRLTRQRRASVHRAREEREYSSEPPQNDRSLASLDGRRSGGTLSPPNWFANFLWMLRWNLKNIWRQPSTKIGLGFAAFVLWWSASSAATHNFALPSTDLLVHNTNFLFDKLLVLAIVWIAGDLIWKERSFHVDEIVESQPHPDFVGYLAKTAALLVVVLAFWFLSIGVNMAYQARNGYYRFEPGLYLIDSFAVKAPFYLWLSMLAIALQAIVRNRYITISLVLLVYASSVMLDALDWHHPMVHFGRVSHFWYSLMDGYGHFWKAHRWMCLYWTLASVVLWLAGWLCLWRGTNPPSRRWYASRRFRGLGGVAFSVAAIAFLTCGAFVWYQSTALAPWPPLDEDRIKAEIEKAYGQNWRQKPQPVLVEIEAELDLYPEQRRFEMRGTYVLENQTPSAVQDILIPATPGLKIEQLTFGVPAERIQKDEILNMEQWRLTTPLQPGERTTLSFTTSTKPPPGFAVHSEADDAPTVANNEVIGNGTALLNLQIMPAIGYTDRVEHKPKWQRRKYGLPEEWHFPQGIVAENQGHATLHLGWVESYAITIRTAADQTALHGGVLEKEWTEPDGRRAFRYRMPQPSRGWSTIVSGRFQKRVFGHEGLPNVEVYFDPQHEPNVDAFGNALVEAMEYFAKNYGPPPFSTFRLAECSLHYDGFGAKGGLAFCSEILGWKSNLKGDGKEFIHRTAALMMGMTWWGDQVIPANVAGAKIIHSGLPYWTSELYLHETRDFETDYRLRLQAASELFRNRGERTDVEEPFSTEFKDSAMIQKKGSILFLHLAKLVGTTKLKKILSEFLDDTRYRHAPYPSSTKFLEHLKARTPPEIHGQIADIFDEVTLWRLAVRDVHCQPIPLKDSAGGEQATPSWRVKATVDVHKFRTTGWGDETEVDFETDVDLAAFSDFGLAPEKSAIWQNRERLKSGENAIEFEVSQPPLRFGVDPWGLLPDPNPHDNLLRVHRQ